MKPMTELKERMVYDFSNLKLQVGNADNCYRCDCNCDGGTCDCNCDCDSGDCDCNDFCDNED